MSTDQRLAKIEAQLEQLLKLSAPKKQLYDVDDLKAEGLGRNEAYAVLRRYCRKTAGRRLRITHEQLMDYYETRELN